MLTLTPRRLAEAADLARALGSGMPGAALMIVDAEMRILLVDGVHRDPGLVGRRVPDVIPAPSWKVLEPHYLAALGGQAQVFDHDVTGDRRGVRALRLAPLRDDGEVVGVLALSEDVAPRSSGSEWLQHSLLDVLDEGVIVVDGEKRLVQANSAACAVLRLSLAEARADPEWWRAFRARDAETASVPHMCAAVLSTGRGIRDAEIEAEGADGSILSLSANLQPLRDEGGAVSGVVQSFRDVTEQAHEHRRLIENQDRLREAHEVARLSSWEWEPETGVVSVFQSLAGERASAGTRATLEELLVQTPPEERRGAHDDLDAIVRGDTDGSVRRSCRHYPAGDAWLETRTRAVRNAEGDLECVRGTTQDVTEQELARQDTVRVSDFFQATLDSLPAHIAVLGDEGEIVMTNRAWLDFAEANDGLPTGPGSNYLAACDAAGDDEWAQRAAAGLRSMLAGEVTGFSLEYPCHGPREERWYSLVAARFDGPGNARIVVSHDNVTKRRRAIEEVRTQAVLLDEVDVAVVATDSAGLVTRWNRGAERQHGWSLGEALGQNAANLISPPGTAENGHLAEGELLARRKDGSTFPAYVRGRVMVGPDGQPGGRIAVLVDMSERVAAERALVAAGNFMRAIADSMGEGLLTVDTEGRVIYLNDAGAELLGWTLEELRGRVLHPIIHSQRSDGSPLPLEDSPILVAGRERRTVRVTDDVFMHRDGGLLPVAYTASPFETDEGMEGCVVVFADITARKTHEENLTLEAEKLAWIGRIQDALAEGRFLLHAQPIVDLHTGEVVQRELLLRMREPGGEIVGPAAYLDVAEQYGQIGEIDRWVIRRGAEIASTGLPVQINLSAHSIGDHDVLDHIERCMEDTGADPSHLVFELTETAIVEDVESARAFAERLHTLGCSLALDDFGTGYGGFTYLKQLPVDCLKIDIEFVRDLTTNPASRHVVQAVVALARGFELQTVAEGVEDQETLELLRELGVDLGQGYHIARPAPLDPEPPIGGIING